MGRASGSGAPSPPPIVFFCAPTAAVALAASQPDGQSDPTNGGTTTGVLAATKNAVAATPIMVGGMLTAASVVACMWIQTRSERDRREADAQDELRAVLFSLHRVELARGAVRLGAAVRGAVGVGRGERGTRATAARAAGSAERVLVV